MKTKSLGLLSLSVLVLVMFMSLASASLTLTEVDIPLTADHNTEVTVTFNLTADQNYTDLDWSGSSLSQGTWTTFPTTISITDGETLPLTAVFTIDEYAFGTISDITIEVEDTPTLHTDSETFSSLTINDSPSLSIAETTPLTKTQDGTITITNTGNTALTNVVLELVSGADFTITELPISVGTIAIGATPSQTITSTDIQNLEIGDDNTITIRAISTEANSTDLTLKVPVEFYEGENQGELKITHIDFSVKEGFGENEKYWYPFDEIEVRVDIDNQGNWEIENIELEVCLLDTNTGKCVMNENDMDLSDDKFDLDENNDITIKLNFNIDPDDLDAGNDDYVLYVSAVGKIDNKDSAYDGDKTGDSDSQDIEIRTSETFIIVNNFELPKVVQCGAEVKITADVWNVGDNRIEEEDVHVWIYNQELGINKVVTDLNDLGALDKEILEFTFNVPENAEEKTYEIKFTVYDDKDRNDNDLYENSENEEAEYEAYVKVEGSCEVEQKAVVSAEVESGGKAGEELIIKVTITNTGDELATYVLNAAAYTEWASSAELDETTIILNSGDSKEVLIIFDVSKDVSGDKTFDIEVLSGDELIVKQPVSVSIEKSGFSFFTGNMISGENKYLWGIGALNIILIIIIILVALKFAKK